jgi:hypothetical protein
MQPDDLCTLESDLELLLKHGYGELVITIEKGKVSGHKIVISKKYDVFKTK